MSAIPAEAVQAAAEALTKVRCEHTLGWSCAECRARAALESAAPHLGERIASLIEARRCPSRRLCEECLCRPEDAGVARDAFTAGVGSPVSCPSAAPESTQGPSGASVAPVYPLDPTNTAGSLSAPRGEHAHPHANSHASEHADLAAARQRINRAHTELGDVCAEGPSRRFRMHIPSDPERDTDLIISAALNDADLLVGEVERLRETLARALRIADYHADQHRQAEESIADLNDLISQERAIHEETIRRAEQAEAAVARVRAAHPRVDNTHGACCQGCGTSHVFVFWPCQVIRDLDGLAAASEEQTGGGNG